MIDMLNKTGLDVSVIGNHEFDYGQAILNDRLEQANFPLFVIMSREERVNWLILREVLL